MSSNEAKNTPANLKSSQRSSDPTTRPSSLTDIIKSGRVRLAVFVVLFIGLSAAVPYVIYHRLGGDLPTFSREWLSGPFLLACAALLLLYFSCDALRLFYTLKSLGYHLSLKKFMPLVFINILVSNISPMATGGGLAQIWYLRGEGVRLGTATAATTLRTLQAVAFIFLPTPFLLLSMESVRTPLRDGQAVLLLALVAIVYLIFFALVLWRIKWLMTMLDLILNPLLRRHPGKPSRIRRWRFGLRREMLRFSYATRSFFRGAKTNVLLALFFTALFLLSLFSFPALLLWGLGYSIDYPTSLGLLVVTTFIMYFSPTPGAAGVAEGAFGLFFHQLISANDLLLTIVAWRFLTIYLGMLIGIPVTLRTVFGRDRHHV